MRHFVLLLQLTALGTSRVIVTRQDEGDYFSGIVTVQCHEISAYEDSDGCHCDQGLTFSTEHMECQSYEGRGNYVYVSPTTEYHAQGGVMRRRRP